MKFMSHEMDILVIVTIFCSMNQIREVNAEVNQLIEKRMMSGDPMDDKLSLFRQQVLNN